MDPQNDKINEDSPKKEYLTAEEFDKKYEATLWLTGC